MYKTSIGLEIHIQLKTLSKMFCRCENKEGARPNTSICPICLGMPGVLPAINRKAVEWAIKVGLALGCRVSELTKFDRKHYFYPDLPKNYQISQYDLPLCKDGEVEIEVEGKKKKVGIIRVHLEEDAGKLIHPEGANYSLVDLNRAGIPLMEVVTKPDLESPKQAKIFLQELRAIARYLEVSSADMEKGQLRCDANISVSKTSKLGVPVEIKNMNSFRMVERALTYEGKRQKELLEKGEKVIKETRGYNDAKSITVSQRSKEFAHDYRYFPEPDLPPIKVKAKEGIDVNKIKAQLPELPSSKRERLKSEYQISAADAGILAQDKFWSDYFEQVAKSAKPQLVANWMINERLGIQIKPEEMIEFINLISSGQISETMGKNIAKQMLANGKSAREIVEREGLQQITDEEEIRKIVQQVIGTNPKAWKDLLAGKERALGFLIGQVMRKSQGKANPRIVNKIIKEQMK